MKTDMSPRAVTTRLRRASQLRRLCVSLGKARSVDSGGSDKETEAKLRSVVDNAARPADGMESG